MIDEIAAIRLGVFLTILVLMMSLELLFPARKLTKTPQSATMLTRWFGNFGLLIISSVMARLILPLGLAGFALYTTQQQWGLLHYVELPYWANIIISILLLDMLIYWQHRLFHIIPLLWRLHKVHHADRLVDSSTALRFHPFEIIASLGIKAITIVILGIPAEAVILFEILLNGFAIFNHANIRLPKKLEKIARYVVVTQILHRIHHSQIMAESNTNFGFSVIWWDRIFGTYSNDASKPDNQIDIGLTQYPNAKQNAWLSGLLWMPFTTKK
ncbi:sterol desaturase family protein [Shewanella sp. MEBiC00475]|uniref:sterol desaturase family protein n=1 Tax=Shewanella sp. MEBiC00475 TaxID=2575361 RepID=UPI0010BFFAF7|nr:sterol desaturase family protein [Shewanella sp. MEBiC00475]